MSFYNSQNLFYKAPFGAVRSGETVTLRIAVPVSYGCETPYCILRKEGAAPVWYAMQRETVSGDAVLFSLALTPMDTGLYFYYFDLYTGYRKLYRGAMGEAFETTQSGEEYQLTVYEASFATAQPLLGGVMYQIFPDRFCEGVPDKTMPYADRIYRTDKENEPYFWPNETKDGYLNMDYYGGDLAGILQKLPYLAQLGVTVIYLNPIFEAHANHRYNTADYLKIDPVLGTNADFAALCKKAKKMGIRIVLDGVFSHTGSDSVYFNREGRYGAGGAYHDVHSLYRPWYEFARSYKCGYRSWWGFETLPEVNEDEPSYRKFICGEGGVIDTWMQLGASGFRLDVADELPDDFIEEIRAAVKKHGDDKFLLGEVWEDATLKESYGARRTYLLGKGLDSVMNYPFNVAVLEFLREPNGAKFAESVMRICETYPSPALHSLMNFMSTHDTARAITVLGGEAVAGHDRYWQSGRRLSAEQYLKARRLLVLGYALLFTLPGIPSIYYGDEIGMQGYKDPFNRGFFDWNANEKTIAAALQKLAETRKTCPAFATGALVITRAEGTTLCYERRTENSTAAICINRSGNTLHETLLGKNVAVPPYFYAIETQS